MSPREAFKAGFLAWCAQNGLSGPEVTALTKRAAALVEKRALGEGLLKQLGGYAATLGLGVPVMAGAGAGYLAHRALNPDTDPEDVQKRELIEELRRFSRRAREHQKSKALRSALGA